MSVSTPVSPNDVSRQVQKLYEERPYPEMGSTENNEQWRLPPPVWMQITGLQGRPLSDFKRILVAGCGRGSEAFVLGKNFPNSQVIGIDFSANSIRIANETKAARNVANVSFIHGDLSDRTLPEKVGEPVDFITNHGVTSYIPNTENVFRNFGDLLAPNGLLYLGTNGVAHPSERLRAALTELGEDLNAFSDSVRLRDLLGALDSIAQGQLGKNSPYFWPSLNLAGDLYGPLINNKPLRWWNEMAALGGLNFISCQDIQAKLRRVQNDNFYLRLMQMSTKQLAEISDLLAPSAFHRALYSKRPVIDPPWHDFEALLAWRPLVQTWSTTGVPPLNPPWHEVKQVKFTIPGVMQNEQLNLTTFVLEVLRRSDGTQSLRRILEQIPFKPNRGVFVSRLHFLYYLLVVNLQPPAA